MPAPKGNRFWEARSRHGRDPIFDSPEMLWEGCLDYFVWAEDNPLMESKATQYQGVQVDMTVAKMRAMTISGLCTFLDICTNTWDNYKKNEDFLNVTTKAELIIRDQKFSGAAADLLNPNIIARDLGLRDAVDKSVTGPDGGPIQITVGPNELARRLAFVLAKGANDSEPE